MVLFCHDTVLDTPVSKHETPFPVLRFPVFSSVLSRFNRNPCSVRVSSLGLKSLQGTGTGTSETSIGASAPMVPPTDFYGTSPRISNVNPLTKGLRRAPLGCRHTRGPGGGRCFQSVGGRRKSTHKDGQEEITSPSLLSGESRSKGL